MSNDSGSRSSLFNALRSIAATLLASGKTRLELLGNELAEEKIRFVRLLVFALAMVFCFAFGALVAVAGVTALFWEYRVLVLGIFFLLFVVLGFVFYNAFRQAAHRTEHVFADSIAELQEDINQLRQLAGYEPPPR